MAFMLYHLLCSICQVHRNGHWGWQSACCTTSLSQHPLPSHPTRKGARLAGRRMSATAFLKLANHMEVREDGTAVTS